ncbi:DUF2783 domain-containing protein [Acidovorax carolinensis]|uniref:DUF2783 domain-containing protein n=1 Tax=Acidovorax carolinensis TaxID=553814 RepID=A0A240UEN6_9BURK|nr:DUF2783 domain-containing protein [Acidovorax carolinensis]ART54770.1 DUF2783 domain-containing protein [Acidovorax carolinensis]ART59533.1 DUF2783 domain-containing protein [Acidovorax carolinensis]
MLNTEPNFQSPDDFYQSLIEAHRGLTDEQSTALNARIILLLSNHIGDTAVWEETLRVARQSLQA